MLPRDYPYTSAAKNLLKDTEATRLSIWPTLAAKLVTSFIRIKQGE